MDGMEATKQIRAIESKENRTPVIVFGLTSNMKDDDLKKYQEAGMNGCIAKGNPLGDALKAALDEHEKNPEKFIATQLR